MSNRYGMLKMQQAQVISTPCGSGEISSTLHSKLTNASKKWLVTKKEFFSRAEAAFQGTGVQTTEGRPYLGVLLGTDESSVTDKINQWSNEVNILTNKAQTLPTKPSFTV